MSASERVRIMRENKRVLSSWVERGDLDPSGLRTDVSGGDVLHAPTCRRATLATSSVDLGTFLDAPGMCALCSDFVAFSGITIKDLTAACAHIDTVDARLRRTPTTLADFETLLQTSMRGRPPMTPVLSEPAVTRAFRPRLERLRTLQREQARVLPQLLRAHHDPALRRVMLDLSPSLSPVVSPLPGDPVAVALERIRADLLTDPTEVLVETRDAHHQPYEHMLAIHAAYCLKTGLWHGPALLLNLLGTMHAPSSSLVLPEPATRAQLEALTVLHDPFDPILTLPQAWDAACAL